MPFIQQLLSCTQILSHWELIIRVATRLSRHTVVWSCKMIGMRPWWEDWFLQCSGIYCLKPHSLVYLHFSADLPQSKDSSSLFSWYFMPVCFRAHMTAWWFPTLILVSQTCMQITLCHAVECTVNIQIGLIVLQKNSLWSRNAPPAIFWYMLYFHRPLLFRKENNPCKIP